MTTDHPQRLDVHIEQKMTDNQVCHSTVNDNPNTDHVAVFLGDVSPDSDADKLARLRREFDQKEAAKTPFERAIEESERNAATMPDGSIASNVYEAYWCGYRAAIRESVGAPGVSPDRQAGDRPSHKNGEKE